MALYTICRYSNLCNVTYLDISVLLIHDNPVVSKKRGGKGYGMYFRQSLAISFHIILDTFDQFFWSAPPPLSKLILYPPPSP